MRRLLVISLPILLLWIFNSCSSTRPSSKKAEATKPPAPESEALLPQDSSITIGKLDNGVTYYIRKNQKPEKRAELRLVINAGSILEDDDQRLLQFIGAVDRELQGVIAARPL